MSTPLFGDARRERLRLRAACALLGASVLMTACGGGDETAKTAAPGPVSATPAFKLGEKTDDPLAMYLVDLYTVATNLAGVGGISFPCGFTKGGLPVGFQLQAPALAEPLLLRAADRFQRLTDWHTRRPKAIG